RNTLLEGWLEGIPPTAPTELSQWQSTDIACVECASDCGCEPGSKCLSGYCIPGDPENEPTCCTGPRKGTCPNGAACQQLDGTAGTCQTVAQCEPCSTRDDCEDDPCVSLSPDGALVCAPAQLIGAYDTVCHDMLDEVWLRDACDDWVQQLEVCGDTAHCEAGQCRPDAPEIEVSPTLLAFGDTMVGGSAELTLSIGNIGTDTL